MSFTKRQPQRFVHPPVRGQVGCLQLVGGGGSRLWTSVHRLLGEHESSHFSWVKTQEGTAGADAKHKFHFMRDCQETDFLRPLCKLLDSCLRKERMESSIQFKIKALPYSMKIFLS